MDNIAAALDQAIRAAGVNIVGVSIGTPADKATWTVQPPELEAAAQPVIDGFDIAAADLAAVWATLRLDRTARLVACDWTQLTDAPLDAATVDDWRTYRQALRDVPQDTADPTTVVWPDEPTP